MKDILEIFNEKELIKSNMKINSLKEFEIFVRSNIPDYKKDNYKSTFSWGGLSAGSQTSIVTQPITLGKTVFYNFDIFSGHTRFFQLSISEYGFRMWACTQIYVFLPKFVQHQFYNLSDFEEIIKLVIPIIGNLYLSKMIQDGYHLANESNSRLYLE